LSELHPFKFCEVNVAEQLRKLSNDKIPLVRPPEVEQAINAALETPRADFLAKAEITDWRHAEYIPSECILYLLRRSKFDNDEQNFRALFTLLRARVRRALPRGTGRASGRDMEDSTALDVADEVLFRFQEMLCLDRNGYDERLDFFEVRFEHAIAHLRMTAKRRAWKQEARSRPLNEDPESLSPSTEVEEAMARLFPANDKNLEPRFRKALEAAIGALPIDQRRVIEMLRNGFPIESEDPTVVTIVSVLGCTPKTVWNRRERAVKALREALVGEELP
jgi:DNA-directed RNA polymerase specialized sigma24 family protein